MESNEVTEDVMRKFITKSYNTEDRKLIKYFKSIEDSIQTCNLDIICTISNTFDCNKLKDCEQNISILKVNGYHFYSCENCMKVNIIEPIFNRFLSIFIKDKNNG